MEHTTPEVLQLLSGDALELARWLAKKRFALDKNVITAFFAKKNHTIDVDAALAKLQELGIVEQTTFLAEQRCRLAEFEELIKDENLLQPTAEQLQYLTQLVFVEAYFDNPALFSSWLEPKYQVKAEYRSRLLTAVVAPASTTSE